MNTYNYEFATGNKEVEISDEWMAVLEELDRRDYNNEHAETRRHVSYSYGDDGEWMAADGDEDDLIDKVEAGRLMNKANKLLTEIQLKVFIAIAVEGHTFSSFARIQGITKQSAREYYYSAVKKLRKK